MAERSIIIIGRHGKAPKNPDGSSIDSLVPETVGRMYNAAKAQLAPLVQEAGITPDQAYVRWSGRIRTKHTSKVKAAGALQLSRTDSQIGTPQSVEDLDKFQFNGIPIEEDNRLNYGDPYLNMVVYKTLGAAANLDYGLANPSARMHDGLLIESYDSLSSRTGFAVKEAVRRVTDDGKRFGVVTSHGTVTEPALIHLINSGRTTAVQKVADIGGAINEEEHAILTIDKTDGGVYTASLNYKGQEHKVDLQKLLQ